MRNDYPKLNPKQHPAGHRYLLRESWIRDDICEATLIEWSKNGHAKVRWAASDFKVWLEADDMPEVIEDLGPAGRISVKKGPQW